MRNQGTPVRVLTSTVVLLYGRYLYTGISENMNFCYNFVSSKVCNRSTHTCTNSEATPMVTKILYSCSNLRCVQQLYIAFCKRTLRFGRICPGAKYIVKSRRALAKLLRHSAGIRVRPCTLNCTAVINLVLYTRVLNLVLTVVRRRRCASQLPNLVLSSTIKNSARVPSIFSKFSFCNP